MHRPMNKRAPAAPTPLPFVNKNLNVVSPLIVPSTLHNEPNYMYHQYDHTLVEQEHSILLFISGVGTVLRDVTLLPTVVARLISCRFRALGRNVTRPSTIEAATMGILLRLYLLPRLALDTIIGTVSGDVTGLAAIVARLGRAVSASAADGLIGARIPFGGHDYGCVRAN
mmetsp:Transcript_901/g.1898  ORF Transcript_901/g.1898 Transcript_901/m.1898 type:complete len:170 (+) Transcript_901:64-573(+)